MKIIFLVSLFISLNIFAGVSVQDQKKLKIVEDLFKKEVTFSEVKIIKSHIKELRQKSVPLLIKVMKDGNYPEKSRWHATFLLGKTMGRKSAPFIAKFIDHPNWMMRLAALKSLKALSMNEYHHVYAKALRDQSLIVRMQTLENISHLKIKPLAPHVWKMLYDQSNYAGDNGRRKRINIVKNIIRTLGDLDYKKALKPLAHLMVKNKYKDLEPSLNYSLELISGLDAPKDPKACRKFWASQNYSVAKKI